MSEKGAIKKSTAQAICDAVKVKEGTTEGVPFKDVAERILAIPKAKPEQEKTVDITENGTTEIMADEGFTLSKVTANVNVKASGKSKFAQFVDGTITEITAEDLEGATQINAWAFNNNSQLKSITFPETITRLGTSAFTNTGLVNVVLPSSLRITQNDSPESLFQGCKQLKSIVIPEGTMTMIPYSFCNGCTSLTSVNIPSGVTEIDNYAFSGCSSLTSLTIPATVKKISSFNPLVIGSKDNKATLIFLSVKPPSLGSAGAFNASYLEKIIVPAGSGEAYKTASNWSAYASYIEEATE